MQEDIRTFFEGKTYQDGDFTLHYHIYVPRDYDSAKRYPVIFFFHGAGQRGSGDGAQLDLGIFTPFLDKENPIYNCIVVAPQCPWEDKWVEVEKWQDSLYSTEKIPESRPLAAAWKLLKETLDSYSIDKDRVYITGLSMGGYATWDMLVRHTDVFAAAIPICGGCDVDYAHLLKDMPIWTFHGLQDPTVLPQSTLAMVEKLRALGNDKLIFTPYPDMGHIVWEKAYGEEGLFQWLLSHRRSDRQ